ncbi:unnamed protein product [Thlaspi arvense]|uniref:Uncharacterized protein n=1 Tax=Thlaspi arvense TaxID=13288 RepID=A0AAU9SKZ8_THLAR|nr:unnamed protein product [Thlaspi arvense]
MHWDAPPTIIRLSLAASVSRSSSSSLATTTMDQKTPESLGFDGSPSFVTPNNNQRNSTQVSKIRDHLLHEMYLVPVAEGNKNLQTVKYATCKSIVKEIHSYEKEAEREAIGLLPFTMKRSPTLLVNRHPLLSPLPIVSTNLLVKHLTGLSNEIHAQSCLDLSDELFGRVNEPCRRNLDRSRCCPVLAACLLATHARSALQLLTPALTAVSSDSDELMKLDNF